MKASEVIEDLASMRILEAGDVPDLPELRDNHKDPDDDKA